VLDVGFSIGPDVWDVGVLSAGDDVGLLAEGGFVGFSPGEVDAMEAGGCVPPVVGLLTGSSVVPSG